MAAPFALIQTLDQWRRTSHEDTALDSGAVQLAWEASAPLSHAEDDEGEIPGGAGMAFDPWCRLYRSIPESGQVERILWAADRHAAPPEVPLFAPEPAPEGFSPVGDSPGPLQDPRGLAADGDGRLFIAETGAGSILVVDLLERRLLRRVRTGARPLDLARSGRHMAALLAEPPGLATLDARGEPQFQELPGDIERPSRLAAAPGGALTLLTHGGTRDARIIPLGQPGEDFAVPFATDIAFQQEGVLVVARRPGEDFLRFQVHAGSRDALLPLRARGYDGRGIVRTPDGRIGFWTGRGFRTAVSAPVRYASRGRVTTFRLDSGQFQNTWGRLFLDACLPEGTDIRIHCLTLDDLPEEAVPLPRIPPANAGLMEVHRPDLSPPMPPADLVPGAVDQRLHRRASGCEIPWADVGGAPFATYEAPVIAPPGRYLWVTLELRGNTRSSPRIRSLRVEHRSHRLLEKLPKIFSREERAADFLRRYLALFDGFLDDIDGRATLRRAMLDPWSAPPELLPWLASFLGLVLDERWPLEARRKCIAEAIPLFRFRGTLPGLKRFIEIYLDREVVLIEHFRVRGLGGALVGGTGTPGSSAILGAGFRVGGHVGGARDDTKTPSPQIPDTYAHRFSLVIPASLDREALDVVRHILELHRPAHTTCDICTADTGMRVGMGLHVGLTAIVGRTGGFTPLRLGGSILGREAILGRPQAGGRVGSLHAGQDSTVG